MDDYPCQQCSGVPPEADQQTKSTPWIGVAHKMDFLSPVLAFRCNTLIAGIQGWIFTDLPPAENLIRLRRKTQNGLDLWQSRLSLTWPTGSGFRFRLKPPAICTKNVKVKPRKNDP
jgi:hypothetical protein